MKSLISIQDFSKEEILHVLEVAKEFEKDRSRKILEGKVVGSLFFEPSTRTRLSFETAVNRLGARVIGFSDATNTSVSKGETLKVGQRVEVYLLEVKNCTRGPRISVSRTHPDLVKKLFEQEAGEVRDGIVEIKAIAREAGSRTRASMWRYRARCTAQCIPRIRTSSAALRSRCWTAWSAARR